MVVLLLLTKLTAVTTTKEELVMNSQSVMETSVLSSDNLSSVETEIFSGPVNNLTPSWDPSGLTSET